jgi:hypothetical protein
MKNIVFVWVILLGFFAFSISALADESSDYLVSDWEYRPEAGINNVEISDLNNDGVLELIASSRDGIVYNLDEKSKDHLKWQYKLVGNIRAINVADFDKDGKKEVIAGSDGPGTTVAIINWQGLDMSSTIGFTSPVNDVAVGDFDGDGMNDLAVASLKTVHALRFTKSGEKGIWDYSANGTVYYVHVFDYNGDGKGEMLYASGWNKDGKDYGEVVMLSSAGKEIWYHSVKGGFPFAVSQFVSSTDINSDGREEIIVGSKTSGVTVLDGDGNTLWSYSTEKQVNVVTVSALSGVTGPVILLGAAPYVYALNAQGTLLWKFGVNTTVYSFLVKDVDGDSRAEVLVGANKYLHIVSEKGVGISSVEFGKPTTGQTFASKNIDIRSIAAGDLTGDNTMEVAVGQSWSESRQDQNYYFGNIVVYEVNRNFVKPGAGATTSTAISQTSTTVPKVTTTSRKETTSSTTTTSAATTSTIPPAGGNNNTTILILGLIVAGGIVLVIVAALLFILMRKKH